MVAPLCTLTSRAVAWLVAASVLAACARRGPEEAPTKTSARVTAPLDPLRKAADGLYFLDIPGSRAKATVVELADGVALVEVPASDQGGDAKRLDDHVEVGEQIVRTLRVRFPGKPLKYVLSSHWHPHSLSAVAPFIDAGATLVTTRTNFERWKTVLADPNAPKVVRAVRFVDGDRFALDDRDNPIVAHRVTRREYPSIPTDDYLIFELPRYSVVHAACMYSRFKGPKVMGREYVTAREHDLHALIVARHLTPTRLIRVDKEEMDDELLPFADLERVVREGIGLAEVAAPFRARSVDALREGRGRLVAEAAKQGIPGSVFNALAFESIEAEDLPRAIEYATLQALLAPDDPNAWDTLGEVHYFLGDVDAARTYQRMARRLAPSYDSGGETVWANDLARYRLEWAARAPGPRG